MKGVAHQFVRLTDTFCDTTACVTSIKHLKATYEPDTEMKLSFFSEMS